MNKELIIFIVVFLLAGDFCSGGEDKLWKGKILPGVNIDYSIIDFIDSTNGWIFSKDGKFIITTDGGNSWRLDSIQLKGEISNVKVFHPQKCWFLESVAGYYAGYHWNEFSVYLTTNGGITWTAKLLSDSSGPFTSTSNISFIDENIFFLIPQLPGGRSGQLYKTTNGGVTFDTIIRPDLNRSVSGLLFLDPLNGYFGGGMGSDGFIYHTTNGGTTWQKDIPQNIMSGLGPMIFYGKRLGSVILQHDYYDILYYYTYHLTNDGGATWTSHDPFRFGVKYEGGETLLIKERDKFIKKDNDSLYIISESDSGSVTQILDFDTYNQSYAWILGSSRMLFSRCNPTVHVVERNDIEVDHKELLIQNYPNPFNGITNYEFRIRNAERVTIKVFDLLGREVATVVDERMTPGEHAVRWSSGALPSGMYLYKIQSGSCSAVKKMVLLR